MRPLTPRERWAVSLAGPALILFLIVQFILFPLMDKRARLVKGLAARQKAVVEMRSMQQRYASLNRQADSMTARLAQRPPGFSLFAFVEQNAAETEVKDRIAYMKPSESPAANDQFTLSQVEMKLTAISLRQLVEFLQKTESPERLVGIEKIVIQHTDKEGSALDVFLQLVSVDQAVGAAPR